MAVTNYYSVNGQIIGESTNGVRTDYHRDALGSVVATTDQNQNVTSTARYAAYGTPFATTGNYSTLRFGWCGSWGYRKTQRSGTGLGQSEVYVRARHCSTLAGRWTTADPAESDLNPYRYCDNSPVLLVDPSGMLTVTAAPGQNHLSEMACGKQGFFGWDFVLDQPCACVDENKKPEEGYFVQKVHVQCSVSDCNGVLETSQDFTYFEAWEVLNGAKMYRWRLTPPPPGGKETHYWDTDEFIGKPPDATCGSYKQTKTEIKFFCASTTGHIMNGEGKGLPDGEAWALQRSHGSGKCITNVGHIWSLRNEVTPTWFGNTPVEGPASRKGEVKWDCCSSPKTVTPTVSPM